jgi:hypothetical protein
MLYYIILTMSRAGLNVFTCRIRPVDHSLFTPRTGDWAKMCGNSYCGWQMLIGLYVLVGVRRSVGSETLFCSV